MPSPRVAPSRSARRPFRRFAPAALLIGAAFVVLTGCDPVTLERNDAVALINADRAAHGLGALTQSQQLSNSAEWTAVRMRDAWVTAGCPDNAGSFLVHTADLVAFYHPESVNRNWRRVGENIGVTGVADTPTGRKDAVAALERAYMNSPKHRDNILGNYTHVGEGFVAGPTPEQSAAGHCPGRVPNSVLFNAQAFVK